MKLKQKMIVYIGTIVFLSFAVTLGIVASKSGKMASNNAMENINEVARHYGQIVKADIEVAMDTTRTLALTFEGLRNED